MDRYFYSHNRSICSVFEDMRDCLKVHTKPRVILSLVAEAQVMANRMEAALYDQKDVAELHNRRKKLKQEVNKLADKKEALAADIEDLTAKKAATPPKKKPTKKKAKK